MRPKKVLFFSQDPGGTNALIPIIRELGGTSYIAVIGKDSAIPIYERKGIPFVPINKITNRFDTESIKKIIADYQPDMVLTGTGAADFFERYIWAASRELFVKSVAVLDSWCYYGLRFSNYTFKEIEKYEAKREIMYLPDRLLVMDQDAKTACVKEGIDGSIIYPCGQPFFQELSESFAQLDQKDVVFYQQKISSGDKKKIIIYASDNLSDSFPPNGRIFWGYDEKTIFLDILSAIEKVCTKKEKYVLVIRPHPKEKKGTWEKVIDNLDVKELKVIVDGTVKEEIAISSADLVIGMWSMFLTESIIAKKRVISVQIGAKRQAPFILEEKGLFNPILDKRELESQFKRYFSGEDIGNIRWNVDMKAVEKAKKYIQKFL